MILLEIKRYLKDKQFVNLQELSLHFQRDPEIMREMLGHWLRKGVICKAPNPAGCGLKCVKCKPEFSEVYQFQRTEDRGQNVEYTL